MRRLLLLLGALPLVALAQDPDAPVDRTRLPSLTPRVFESRGTLSVSLPDIERQPLSGFGPGPRTFEVPADRRAVERAFVPDLDALPTVTLPAPPPPETDVFALRRFRAEAGAGANLGRYGRLDLSGTGASGEFFVDAAYDGVDGTDGYVAFDRMEARAGGRSFAPGRLRIEGFGLVDTYTTPGDFSAFERRRRVAYGTEAGIEGVGAMLYALSLGFEQGRLEPATSSETTTTEGRLDATARLGALNDRLRLDAAGGLAGAGSVGSDVRYGSGGLAVAFGREDGARLLVGARVLAYDALATAGNGNATSAGPIVDLSLPLGPTRRLFASNDPHLGVRSLTDLTGENPFVRSNPIVVPDVVPVDARAGLELRPGPALLRAFALARYAPTSLVFETLGGQFGEAYEEVTQYGLGADVTVAVPSGVSASAGVEIRHGEIAGGSSLPFYAPLVGRAGLQVPFADGRGRIGFGAEGESARPADRTGTVDAPAFGRLTLDGRFDVTGPVSLVARGVRLLGEAERWPGYPEPPFTFLLGLRISR